MKKFGLQLFSIRDRVTTLEDMNTAFTEIAKMGYTQIQTAGTYDNIPVVEFAKSARLAGLYVCGTHYSYDRIKNDIEGTISYHSVLGSKIIGVGGASSMSVFESKENLLAFIKEFNELAEIYAKYGFKLSYHNHATEGIKLDGKPAIEYMIEGFSENVTFCFDTYWAQVAGFDIVHMINRLAGRIEILHLKDLRAFYEYKLENGHILHGPNMVEVGKGNLDFPRIVAAAEEAGCKYFIVEDEYYSTGDSMESVNTSATYIKENLIEA